MNRRVKADELIAAAWQAAFMFGRNPTEHNKKRAEEALDEASEYVQKALA